MLGDRGTLVPPRMVTWVGASEGDEVGVEWKSKNGSRAWKTRVIAPGDPMSSVLGGCVGGRLVDWKRDYE